MKKLEDGLPIIIDEKTSFSCFAGFAKGSIELTVYDQGTNDFPALAKVNSNLGSGSISITLSKNETIKKSISGVDIKVEISSWKCTTEELSFHVKASAKKSIFSCTVFDRTLKGARHNKAIAKQQIENILQQAEASKA